MQALSLQAGAAVSETRLERIALQLGMVGDLGASRGYVRGRSTRCASCAWPDLDPSKGETAPLAEIILRRRQG